MHNLFFSLFFFSNPPPRFCVDEPQMAAALRAVWRGIEDGACKTIRDVWIARALAVHACLMVGVCTYVLVRTEADMAHLATLLFGPVPRGAFYDALVRFVLVRFHALVDVGSILACLFLLKHADFGSDFDAERAIVEVHVLAPLVHDLAACLVAHYALLCAIHRHLLWVGLDAVCGWLSLAAIYTFLRWRHRRTGVIHGSMPLSLAAISAETVASKSGAHMAPAPRCYFIRPPNLSTVPFFALHSVSP